MGIARCVVVVDGPPRWEMAKIPHNPFIPRRAIPREPKSSPESPEIDATLVQNCPGCSKSEKTVCFSFNFASIDATPKRN